MIVGGVVSKTISSLPAGVHEPSTPYSTVTVLVPSADEPPVAGSTRLHDTTGTHGCSCQEAPSFDSRIVADASVGAATATLTVAWLVAALPPSMAIALVAAATGRAGIAIVTPATKAASRTAADVRGFRVATSAS